MFKKIALAVLALAVIAPASASIIVGPSLNNNDAGWANTGVAFQANSNTALISFFFNSQNHPDTVVLADLNGFVLHSVASTGGVSNVNWALTSGSSYLLLQTANSNAMFTFPGSSPGNADIQITDSGLFGCSGLTYSNCGINGSQYWAAFTNITTGGNANAVPEPASIALLGLALAGLSASRRRKLK